MKVIAWPAFKIRYLNPYNWLLYSPMSAQGVQVTEFSPAKLLVHRYDVFHLHWAAETIVRHPNPVVAKIRARTMLALIDWAKLRGTKIVWTFHDKIPHIILHPQVASWFQAELLSRIDGYISMCQMGKTIAEECFPILKTRASAIVPHGHYRGEYPNQVDRMAARKELSMTESAQTILFLGNIAAYKNVPLLIGKFRELDSPDAVLLVAGRPNLPANKTEVLQAASGDARIRLCLEHVPNDLLQVYFQAADLVVLPFAEILNSGSAMLALSFDRPILVPRKGAMAELQALVGGSWVKTYSDELTTDILREGLSWALHTPRPEKAPLEALEWPVLSKNTIKLYRTVSRGKGD